MFRYEQLRGVLKVRIPLRFRDCEHCSASVLEKIEGYISRFRDERMRVVYRKNVLFQMSVSELKSS